MFSLLTGTEYNCPAPSNIVKCSEVSQKLNVKNILD